MWQNAYIQRAQPGEGAELLLAERTSRDESFKKLEWF